MMHHLWFYHFNLSQDFIRNHKILKYKSNTITLLHRKSQWLRQLPINLVKYLVFKSRITRPSCHGLKAENMLNLLQVRKPNIVVPVSSRNTIFLAMQSLLKLSFVYSRRAGLGTQETGTTRHACGQILAIISQCGFTCRIFHNSIRSSMM